MDIWKVAVEYEDFYFNNRTYVYSGTASKPEIAIRAAMKAAKKDGLVNRKLKTLEHIGEKDFGRR